MTFHPHPTGLRRRDLMAAALAATALPLQAQTGAGTRPVSLVMPFGPGGSVDVLARALGGGMAEHLGTTIVPENKPGGSGALAASQVMRAKPDGSTLFFGSSTTHAVLPNVRKDLPYDPVADFTPISGVAEVENALVVHPSLPIRNVAEFVAYAKAHPGAMAYGSHGTGGIVHLAAELFKLSAGIDTLHVPYKAAADLDLALMAGQLQWTFATLASSIPHVRSGKMRAIAVCSRQRSPFLPDLPTLTEAGYPVVAVSWGALYGPRGLSDEHVRRYNEAARAALTSKAVTERFHNVVAKPMPTTPKELADYQAREFAQWAQVVKTARIPLEG